ncbi:oligopeptide transport system ATP-binding protein [Jatrophihabitans endophyticus]|uniref:Oligopeptide transport system ATP-binding protein n=1 Tax=Jatrophihabitans endophyticus TaxID=1206085 RepID=A0A1M5EKR1_9ACTN|nr:ABC transporter ATP-binding protein [Jatrophihabitans endophyticus]SHF79622.1 oligopeptide transport system ATP-binding protein [Jatrophihabitans endophyticus]
MSTDTTTEHPTGPLPGTAPLLVVHDLHVDFAVPGGAVRAVRGVSFELAAGETLAVLGESGSGKSVTAQAIMGLLDPHRATVRGAVRFRGTELVGRTRAQRRREPGRRVAMVFQDALAALNPVASVGAQIAEVLRVHDGLSRRDARGRAVELMARVGIPAPDHRFDSYPHQLSGGMRQRIMIATALALGPELLIADEPTTALDVTVQAQIMQLLADLRDETGLALLFITHDLAASAELADRIAVMYAGRVVETGTAREVYASPRHPYTAGLLGSVPRVATRGRRLTPIAGSPPSPAALPSGCAFHPRCPMAQDVCTHDDPPARAIAPGHRSACHFAESVHRGGAS